MPLPEATFATARTRSYDLSVTTQGPLHPPSEIVDENGDSVVIGMTDRAAPDGSAVVSSDSAPPVRHGDGTAVREPLRLAQWARARGQLTVHVPGDRRTADFSFTFTGLIPDSLYAVMSLREHGLDPAGPARPGPLGIPGAFLSDRHGTAHYQATLLNPFPGRAAGSSRITNVVVLWMSNQLTSCGATGSRGPGGDLHAQLTLRGPAFQEFTTVSGG
ncbi:hypothetical protein [Streptomyces sp. NPDC049813]|uniref:hypothetical protein n=1 Tax=Streptomyces sp. NPDC049813 TaxID=3365597 RepID=UPI0037A3801B